MTDEVMKIEIVLQDYRIDNMKIIDSRNNHDNNLFVRICYLTVAGTSLRVMFHFAES
jgi:hypothetical protein